MKASYIVAGFAAVALAAPAVRAQATYKRDVPDSLVKHAKITEAAAVATAQAKVPKGTIESLELEREDGKLLWSFDFKVPGKTGIDEVNVNAVTGKAGKVEHESPAAEKKEAAADAKEAAAKAAAKKEALTIVQFEVLQIALSALRANLLRSLLTMLGIVIGVAAVIAMIALGDGAQKSVRDRITALGTTVLQIDATWVRQGGVQTNVRKRITIDDVRSIDERSPHILGVEAQQDKSLQLQWGDKNTNITIVGVTPNFLGVRNFEIDRGDMFTSGDDLGRQRVAVLGAGALTQLGITNPDAIIGQHVRIGGMQFTVIGTLKSKGAGAGGGSPDDQVIIPFGTGRYRLFKTDRLDDIFALASSDSELTLAMSEITLALRRSHRLTEDQPDDFRIRNQSDFLQTLGETTAVFTTLLAGIAAVSLLVGGIGIMNIMLVSVTERTREIGIRKALGATRRNILFQFLIEAVTLCLLGGAIGIATGVGGAILLRNSFGWSTAIGPASIVMAFVFAAGVGILFGVWPARRASTLDPIEALRYE